MHNKTDRTDLLDFKKIPNTHSRSASYLANMIFVELFNQDSTDHYSHVRGSRHNYLGIAANALKTEIYGLIVPDWVFERDVVVVAIENDTGTQRGFKVDVIFAGIILFSIET